LAVIDEVRPVRLERTGRLADWEFVAQCYLEMPEVQAGKFCQLNFRPRRSIRFPRRPPAAA